MQDVNPWPESFDVSEPVARVLVDGKEVAIESVSVSSELDSAMPERVAAGGGGVVAATGDATVLRADDVAEAGFNPWGDAQQFVNASEVVVEAGYRDPAAGDVGCARQITGQVESLAGGALSNTIGLEFVDYTPLLNRDITVEPLLEIYPPLEDLGPIRGAGLSPIYVTDRVLRHCGFHATPPMIPGALFSAPMMGSAVPERGTFLSGWATSDTTKAVEFVPAPWGMALVNGALNYTPNLTSSNGRITSTMHVSFLRRQSTDQAPDFGRIELRWGPEYHAVRILTHGSGDISVQYQTGDTATTIVQLSATDVSESEAFTVLVAPSGRATIYASNGATVSGMGTLPPRATSSAMNQVHIRVPQSSHPIGGVQVAQSATRNHTFQRNAHIDPPAYYYSLQAFPFQHEINCLELLKGQAEAELAAMWFDEHGHFQWRNRHQLRDTAPRGTLTSRDNLLDLPWDIPVRSVYSRVELEHDIPTVTRRLLASIPVSGNRGSSLSNGDTEDRFFEPPADQDWHLVEAPQWMGGTVNYWRLLRGAGSYRGGIRVDEDNRERLAYSTNLHQAWSQINPQRWLLSSQARDLRDNEHIEQALLDRIDLYDRFAGDNLPIIRAKGLVAWEQDKTLGAARGPALAPVYVHKVGPWIQGASELRALANWVAEHLTKPEPVLRRVRIVPDPRIQLGDVFWLEDTSAYSVRLRVVVMGKTLRYQASDSGHEMSQEITCRVIDVERLGVRYDELETAWASRDYSALESAWSGQVYDVLEADPLDRS